MADKKLTREQLEKRELELKIAKAERELVNYDSHPEQHTTLVFYTPVTGSSVAEAIYDLDLMSRRYPDKDITILLNSPGGSVIDGYALMDFIEELKRRGHRIVIKVLGNAASMGAIILQAADERVMSNLSVLCIHEMSSGFEAQLSKMKAEVKFVEKLSDKSLKILSDRSGTAIRTIKSKCKDGKDWWMDAEEALKFGFCDRVE